MKTKLIILTMIITFASLFAAGTLYSAMNDKSDRLSSSQSSTFSPGYINAAMQKTQAIVSQVNGNKDKSRKEENTEYMDNKLSNDVREDAAERVVPELKKKTGGTNRDTPVNQAALSTITTSVIDSTQYNVDIGSGKDKIYQNNRLISEVINGTRHVYAGFANVGTVNIQDAISRASEGDMIIVKGREFTVTGAINIKNGIKLFGGYDETGHRDIIATPTTVNGAFRADAINRPTEINGFTINIDINRTIGAGIYFYDCTDALRIVNNNIRAPYGIGASNSRAVIYNNFIHSTQAGINTIKSSSITASNNIIEGKGYGILEKESGSIYTNNVIRNSGIGIGFISAYSTTLNHNTIYGAGKLISSNGYGYAVRLTSNVLISDATFFESSVKFSLVQDNVFGHEGKFYADPQCTIPTVNLGKAGYSSNSPYMSLLSPYYPIPPEGEEANPIYSPTYNPNYTFQTKWINNVSYQNIIDDAKNTIDPAQGLYSVYGKGYLSDNLSADYGKVTIINPITAALTNAVNNNIAQSNYFNSFFADNMSESKNYMSINKRVMGNESLGYIFKGLLANRDPLMTQGPSEMEIDSALIRRLLTGTINESVLSISAMDTKSTQLEAALALADIMKNPTEDQKLIIDALTALLNKVDKEGAGSPDFEKASNDLLQMVAAVLIAQAIPDLLKEGDVVSIRNIFAELGTSKERIVKDYKDAVAPYYSEMKEILAKNMAVLQLNNMVSKSVAKEDLERLPPIELDKILQKLRQAKEKSFEAEYILQQEIKYRKAYLDPGKEMLDSRMKNLLESFAKKLSGILEGVKSEKK